MLFDLDGVVTPTAEVHMRAWSEMFNAFLSSFQGQGDLSPYTEVDYFAHVDGKPRYDGVRDFLSSRGPFLSRSFTADRFVLFSSRASTGGGPYIVEAEYPLG